jgi:hypothetical protein
MQHTYIHEVLPVTVCRSTAVRADRTKSRADRRTVGNGLAKIEVTSAPPAVPNLRDAEMVMASIALR